MFSKFGLVGSLLSSIVFHFDKYSIRFQVNIQVFFFIGSWFPRKNIYKNYSLFKDRESEKDKWFHIASLFRIYLQSLCWSFLQRCVTLNLGNRRQSSCKTLTMNGNNRTRHVEHIFKHFLPKIQNIENWAFVEFIMCDYIYWRLMESTDITLSSWKKPSFHFFNISFLQIRLLKPNSSLCDMF